MTLCHCSETTEVNPVPFRWPHRDVAQAVAAFQEGGHASQRQFAREQGIPRSTLASWLRPDPDLADLDPPLVAFLRSESGLNWLRRLVLALFVVFVFRGAGGLRLLRCFLQLTFLDRFVASSVGALQQLSQTIQDDLGRFASEEQPRLAEGMTHRHIALILDENFHGPHICLVAAEPVSNFLVVEQYADQRDALTWRQAIEEATAGLAVTVLLLSSDQARGIIACANHELAAQHLPELFHGQRDLCRPLLGPLGRQSKAAHKELQQAEEALQACRPEAAQAAAGSREPGRPTDYARPLGQAQQRAEQAAQQLDVCLSRQSQTLAAVRGLADDYHPFDSETGARLPEADLDQRLGQRLQALQEVAEQAGLGNKAQEALARGQRWREALVFALGWFWAVTEVLLEELDLAEEAQRVVYDQILPGLYWQQAARRARTAEEQHHHEILAERLLREGWATGGVLSQLSAEQQQAVQRVSHEVVGLFARSSSAVEGRNGRLALFHHGQTRLSAGRLKALTTVHNYLVERADGTTAAERFFGKKPRDLFAWLLERLPDLPRPAAKRPHRAAQTAAKAG
jgi:Family of unknown function (DUF6399)